MPKVMTAFDFAMLDQSKDVSGLYDDGFGLHKIGARSAYLMSINDTFKELIYPDLCELVENSLVDFEVVFDNTFCTAKKKKPFNEKVYWSKTRGIILYLQSAGQADGPATLSFRLVFEIKSKIDHLYTMEMQLDELDKVPCLPDMWSDSVTHEGHYHKMLFSSSREGLFTRIARFDLHPRLRFSPKWVVPLDVHFFVRVLNVVEDRKVGLSLEEYTDDQSKKIEELARKKIEKFTGGCYEWLIGGK